MNRRQTKKELTKALTEQRKVTLKQALDAITDEMERRNLLCAFINLDYNRDTDLRGRVWKLHTGGHDSKIVVYGKQRKK